MCARELLSLVVEGTIIKRKNKKVLSKTFPCCSLGLGGLGACWLCVFQRAWSKTKAHRVGAFQVKKETVLIFKKQQKKDFLHPLSSSGRQSCTHGFGGHFKKDATSVIISPGTNSSILLTNLPRTQGSKQR